MRDVLAQPSSGAPAAQRTPARLVINLRDAVWRPGALAMRRLALAGVVVNAGIIVTGGAVRVSRSGLGCPTWPRCTGDSLIPTRTPGHAPVNMAIEFSNRLVTFLVLAVGTACLVAALRLRPRRPGLVRLAALQPLGVVAQAVLGGVTVLTKLNPAMVAAHFLLSIAILAAAVALHVRAAEGDGPVRPTVRPELRWLGHGLLAVVVVLLTVGTVVTGSGPNAGDSSSPRFHLPIDRVAQLHADIVWLTVGLTIALLLGLRLTDAPRRTTGYAAVLFAVELLQGAVGYVQYFLGVPPVLVGLHVFGASLVWIATLRVVFALRVREALDRPADGPVAPPARTASPGVVADR